MKRILIGLVLASLAFSTAAVAGIGKGNGEIGFDFGFTDFDSNVTDQNGIRFVFRGGYHFSDWFELEGQTGTSVADESILGSDVGATVSVFFVNGVFNFHPTKDIVPYVLVGLGRAIVQFDGSGFSIDDDGSASQLAGGCRFFFGTRKRSAFRLEYSTLAEKTFGEKHRHNSLVAGFTWALGKGR